MAQKNFYTWSAAEYTGIDRASNALEADGPTVGRAENYEFSVSNNLRGRTGIQIAADSRFKFFATFPYVYSRTNDEYTTVYQAPSGVHPNQTPSLSSTKIAADGASQQKLICLTSQGWALDYMNIPFTVLSGATPYWFMTNNPTTGNLLFKIKQDTTEIFSFDCGDGGLQNNPSSILTLLLAIQSLVPSLSLTINRSTCPPFAIVNGNQTATLIGTCPYGTIERITVQAGHTFYPGDILTLIRDEIPGSRIFGAFVRARTATTIDYIRPGVNGTLLSFVGNQVLGYMGQSAATFAKAPAVFGSTPNFSISFPYFRLIPQNESMNVAPFDYSIVETANFKTGSFNAPATAINFNDSLFVASSQSTVTPQLYTGFAGGPGQGFSGSLVKCDSNGWIRAGQGAPKINSVTDSGVGILSGTYKYKVFVRSIDAQGNIVDGNPSPEVSITVSGGRYTEINVFHHSWPSVNGWTGRGGLKNTTESPAAGQFFYVDDGGGGPAYLQIGDPICLTDNTAQTVGLTLTTTATTLGTLHRTRVTHYDGVTQAIRVADSSGYQINDNTYISNGTTIVLLRTLAGGLTFYQLGEIPFNCPSGTITLQDNVTDAVLSAKAQYTEIEIGKEHDPPPPCSLVCEHQGGLVVARGNNDPNLVSFSAAEGAEYFPIASNSFNVPSTRSSLITAIASDTDDQLAVFKERSYYNVVGDLDSGLFSIQIRNENDYGIVSQASLRRVNNSLIGLSRNGFVEIANGNLNPYVFANLNAGIAGRENWFFQGAVAVNDSISRTYRCAVPVISTDGNFFIVQDVVDFSLDYSRPWINESGYVSFNRTFPTYLDAGKGMVSIGDDYFQLSVFNTPRALTRRTIRFNGNSYGNGNIDSFFDNTDPITYVFETLSNSFQGAEFLKTPIRLRVWSIQNNYVVEPYVNFNLNVQTAASPDAALIGNSNNAVNAIINFPNDTVLWRDVKVINAKANWYLVRLTTSARGQSPFLTGLTINYAENYNREDLVK